MDILGLRPTLNGLQIDPSFPDELTKGDVRIMRQWQGARFDIHYSNPKKVNRGVTKITVDGKKIKGDTIKPFGDGKAHKVEVKMG
jgi:cellobiose phosphorylase